MSASSQASDGTITFNGELTASTCNVIVAGQGADATVVLPTVSTVKLANASDVAGRTGFNMALNNCSGTLKTASAFFEAGATVDTVTGRLKNMVTAPNGGATNVSLQLLDGDNSNVIQAGNQNQITKNTFADVASGSGTLSYAVEYFAEKGTTPGLVSSNVVYSIMYK
ncbi:type 1 fimbrial protein [Pantoea sp. S18]|nr:type 1 fimbrial protein [Pantoea sp. S18]MEA5101247.1 type 1 fimbrial protein [Pantoea sp. S18]MRT25703.1 type 1 fimbrial protein [Enterobacteriaceae bacterium RIT697]